MIPIRVTTQVGRTVNVLEAASLNPSVKSGPPITLSEFKLNSALMEDALVCNTVQASSRSSILQLVSPLLVVAAKNFFPGSHASDGRMISVHNTEL